LINPGAFGNTDSKAASDHVKLSGNLLKYFKLAVLYPIIFPPYGALFK